jgi:2-phosphosulfolactate phosphatase
MKLDVYFTPPGPTAGDLASRGVVIIDVLRATTTIITALANGARAVVPAASSEDAVKMTANLERDGFVLAGERRYMAIPGFPLGNSPREMTSSATRRSIWRPPTARRPWSPPRGPIRCSSAPP